MKALKADEKRRLYRTHLTLDRRKIRRELVSLVAYILLEYAPETMSTFDNWHWKLAKKVISGIGI